MNINAAIIDQRLDALKENIREQASYELNITDDVKLKSMVFVFLNVKTILDLSDEEAFDCLTEGGGDFGVDAIHITEEYDSEFSITLFQGKYTHKKLEGDSNFPENGIKSLINAIRHIFDPSSVLENINNRLLVKVEQVRSLIRDGYIPTVRALACNNGLKWTAAAEEAIKRENFGNQVIFEHINHDRLVSIIQAPKQVDDSLQFSGKAVVEDFNYSRVLIGRIHVSEIVNLINRHGEQLLERNIRRYLGLQGNRVNEAISGTLKGSESVNFYFYNNGITLTCDKFNYNALQNGDYSVKIENLQIINGGQTCITIYRTLVDKLHLFAKDSYVLVRLYQLPGDNEDLVHNITYATNSQNPVDLRDLKSNDKIQKRLETDISQLGFTYKRKRMDSSYKTTDFTSGTAAEAILSVWRRKPHQAKFFSREHFGKLYNEIFSNDLNGAQAITAVLIYRYAENKRKRPPVNAQPFVPYASCFIAMQMGRYLLESLGTAIEGLTHKSFPRAKEIIETSANGLFDKACMDIEKALKELYGDANVSPQQLSATFRRGDLIEKLEKLNSPSH